MMKENFEHIFKDALEGYSKPAPDYVLNNLRTHYPKQGFADFVSLNAAKIAVISAIIVTGIITAILLINNSPSQNQKTSQAVAIEGRDVSLVPMLTENLPGQIPLNIASIPVFKNVPVQTSVPSVVDAGVFITNDTTLCADYMDLPSGIDPAKMSHSQAVNIEIRPDGMMRVSAERPGVYYLKYRDENATSILVDSMRVCFAATVRPSITVVDEMNCPGDALTLKVETEDSKNLKWNAAGASIEKMNNSEYRFTWSRYEGQHLTITASSGNRYCDCSSSLNVTLPSEISVNTSVKAATCSMANGEISIICNNDDAVFSMVGGESNSSGEFKNLAAGKYHVWVSYNATCHESIPVTVNDNKKLNADYQYSLNKENPLQVSFENRTTIDNRSYSRFSDMSFIWLIDGETMYGENPTVLFDAGGDKQVSLIASYGNTCFDTVRYTVRVYDEKLLIPNIFSPNGDGISDLFTVKADNTVSFKAVITNTRGEVIYQWTNPAGGWDGRINGVNQAAEGVYFYIISAEFVSGNTIEKRGALNLVRD